jgi:lipoprotein-anchoring transpeptidase ErfK/SrfK
VKRVASVSLLTLGALAGVVFAVLLAAGSVGAAPPQPAYPAAGAPRSTTVNPSGLIAAGVSVGGTLVGGLTRQEAREVIEQRFARPLTLVLTPQKRMRVTPAELGATADVTKALRTATTVRSQGLFIPLKVEFAPRPLERLLAMIQRDVRRKPVEARLVLRDLKPVLVDGQPGRDLDRLGATRIIAQALRTSTREIVLPLVEKAPPKADAFRTAIVIRRGKNRLNFYVDQKLKRSFAVATGLAEFPTPLGRFEVINRQRNPWWYPPNSAWASGLSPVPPGPGNPLGTRWMGISSPSVGIHGTPDSASIGYSASHGCIRMLIPEVEWLFEQVELGTPVFIVPV